MRNVHATIQRYILNRLSMAFVFPDLRVPFIMHTYTCTHFCVIHLWSGVILHLCIYSVSLTPQALQTRLVKFLPLFS